MPTRNDGWAASPLRRTKEKAGRNDAALEGINRILRGALTARSEDELARICLAVAEEVTGAAFSFLGELDFEAGQLDGLSVSERGWKAFTTGDQKGSVGQAPAGFRIHGICERVLLDGRSRIANHPGSRPDRIGMPGEQPPLKSFLGVPLKQEGSTIGMIGLGNRKGGFRQQDLEAAEALAPAIFQVLVGRRTADALRRSEERLAGELMAARSLQDVSAELIREKDLAAFNRKLLDAAIAIMDADAASMQALDPATKQLKLIASRGLDPVSVRFWEWVRADSASTCGIALSRGERVVVTDTLLSAAMAGTDDLAEYQRSNLRAVQSTPLVSRSGAPLGMMSTHWREPHQPEKRQLALIDVLARLAADLLERDASEEAQRQSDEQYRVLFESIDEGFCTIEVLFDEQEKPIDYRFLQVNPVFEKQTGLVGAVGRTMRELAPQHEEFWFEIYGRIVLTGEPVRFEHQASALGRWYDVYAFRVGEPRERRVAVLFRDVLPRKQAEQALRESEERLRRFGEASSDVLWIRDAQTLQWEYLSEAFEKIYGIPRDRALEGDNLQSWTAMILPEDRVDTLASIDRVRRGERAAFEFRIRRPNDGQIRWLRNTDFPIHDEAGRVSRIGAVGHDITQLKDAEEHQRLLLAELQHRVRNTLAVVRSIARRTAEQSQSLEENTAHLEGRINALARVQAVVTRDPLAGIDLASIVAEESRAAGAREGENLTISGVKLKLESKPAETLALAIHELSTNAVKFGALSRRSGCIDVDWKVDGGVLDFRWIESGMRGLAEPTHRGLGRDILERSLAYELKAKTRLSVRPTGLHFEAAIPLDRILSPNQV